MKEYEIRRRQFLKILFSLPVVISSGCESTATKATLASSLSPEESLKKLILKLGPWPEKERDKAEDFARRFMKAGHATAPYLPESGKIIQSLAGRFPDGEENLKEIDLSRLPVKEREIVIALVKQLYSFIEVRFYLSNEPPWGECQGDRFGYTKAPARGSK